LGLRLGYLATSGAKSDVIFSLSDPDFLEGGEISRVPHVVSEIRRGTDRQQTDRRQTDDRRGNRNRRLSHKACQPNKLLQ